MNKTLTNHNDIAFFGDNNRGFFFKIEHKVTETSTTEDHNPSKLATLVTTRATGPKNTELRIQRVIVLNEQSLIPHSEMVREVKAQNAAELYKLMLVAESQK